MPTNLSITYGHTPRPSSTRSVRSLENNNAARWCGQLDRYKGCLNVGAQSHPESEELAPGATAGVIFACNDGTSSKSNKSSRSLA